MTVVVDSSVLAESLVDARSEGEWAEAALAADARAAPELAGEISRLEATSAHRDLLRLDLELFSFMPFAERVWALRHNLTAYDAWYVALAEALDCPLMTLDGRLSRASGPTCEIIVPPQQQPAEHG